MSKRPKKQVLPILPPKEELLSDNRLLALARLLKQPETVLPLLKSRLEEIYEIHGYRGRHEGDGEARDIELPSDRTIYAFTPERLSALIKALRTISGERSLLAVIRHQSKAPLSAKDVGNLIQLARRFLAAIDKETQARLVRFSFGRPVDSAQDALLLNLADVYMEITGETCDVQELSASPRSRFVKFCAIVIAHQKPASDLLNQVATRWRRLLRTFAGRPRTEAPPKRRGIMRS